MKINAQKLREGFELVDAVPQHTSLLSSQYVQCTTKENVLRIKLSGIASACATVECEGIAKFLADRYALGAFLKRATGTVLCDSNEKGVVLRSGGAKLELTQPKDVTGYGNWKPTAGKRLALEGNVLELLSEYAKPNPSEPDLEVICFKKGYGSFSTDTIIGAVCKDPSVSVDCLLPRFIANLAGKHGLESLWVEPDGVAIQYPNGFIHQPLPIGDKAYPVDMIKGLFDKAAQEKELFTVGPPVLLEALQYLKSYTKVFSSELTVRCTPASKPNLILLRLEHPTVKAECKILVNTVGSLPEKWSWSLERILPWVSHIRKSDVVTMGMFQHLYWFRCKEGKKMHILVSASTDA